MTKQEFESYLAAHPAEKDALTSYFTVITRDPNNRSKLVPVEYSKYYHNQLQQAATLLREAADLSQNASLTDFLRICSRPELIDVDSIQHRPDRDLQTTLVPFN